MKAFLFFTFVFFMFLTLGLVAMLDFKHALATGIVVIVLNAYLEHKLTEV